MAIKDFFTKDSYSRIERVDVMKGTETVDFYLSVYTSSDLAVTLIKDLRYTVKNNPLFEKCVCHSGKTEEITMDDDGNESKVLHICGLCNGSGYNSLNEYDNTFKEDLKKDENILSLCYKTLMKRPEFKDTTEV